MYRSIRLSFNKDDKNFINFQKINSSKSYTDKTAVNAQLIKGIEYPNKELLGDITDYCEPLASSYDEAKCDVKFIKYITGSKLTYLNIIDFIRQFCHGPKLNKIIYPNETNPGMLKEIVMALYDYYYLCYGEKPATEKEPAYKNIVEIVVNISQCFHSKFTLKDRTEVCTNLNTKLQGIEVDTSQLIDIGKKLDELKSKSPYYKSFLS